MKIWGQLFEINDVVSERFVKILNNNITNTLGFFFCWKNVRILCTAKDSHIVSTKNNSVFDDVVRIYLTI